MQWEPLDETQQLAAEQTLATLYRSLFPQLADAIVVADTSGRIIEANPAAAALLGYSQAALIKRHIRDVLVVDRAVAAARASLRRATGGQGRWQGRWQVRRSDQRLETIDVTITTIQSSSGLLYAAIGHSGSLAGRTGDPLPLLQTALEQTNDAVVITTADLDWPGPQIVYVNDAFTTLTGYSAEEAIGKTPRILQGPDTDRAVLDRARAALERGEAVHDELINYRKDGTPYFMEWRIAPVRDMSGTITHWVSIQRDISEHKRDGDERERLYRATQAALSARDQLLTIVSHELKTPLTSLMGYAYLLQRADLDDPRSTARVQQAVKVITQQAQRLNVLIEELLDLSRIQGGSLNLQLQTLDLAELAREVVTEFQPVLEQHSLTLIAPGEPQLISGDKLRLRHVLQQLVQNAIIYSPRGGPIHIRVEPRLHEICLSVIDRGIGIPDTAQRQIFERFYRATNVNPSQISGFGVGLYIVHEIITRHGGMVAVSSSEGQGSTFTICLPRGEQSTDSLAGH